MRDPRSGAAGAVSDARMFAIPQYRWEKSESLMITTQANGSRALSFHLHDRDEEDGHHHSGMPTPSPPPRGRLLRREPLLSRDDCFHTTAHTAGGGTGTGHLRQQFGGKVMPARQAA